MEQNSQREQKIVYTGSAEQTARLFGAFDVNMKIIEDAFGVSVHNRASDSGDGDALFISGATTEAVNAAAEAVEALKSLQCGQSAYDHAMGVLYPDAPAAAPGDSMPSSASC